MSSIQRCGFCSLLSGLVRRALCIGSRRGSSESYYRELGDQDTLKIDGSQGSDDSAAEIEYDAVAQHEETRGNQDAKKCESEGNQDKKSSPNAHGEPLAEVGQRPRGVEPAPVARRSPSSSEEMVQRPATGRFLSLHRRRRRRLLTRALTQDSALLDDLQHGQVQCVLEQSAMWRFNAFTLDNVSAGRCLPVLCMHLFQTYGLISHFKLDPARVWRLFSMFEEGYHNTNPYHNSVHAADVTQAMHCFLQQKVILEHLEPIEVMASLVAAIVHDLDHPGVNQQFLIATSNHLAALYKNKSVLENHHWRSAISILLESQILDQMSNYREQLFQQISSLILATDITRQQEYLSQFKMYMDTDTLDMRQPSHRHLILQIALKCADISNPCRPWEISRKWSLKVCEEFFRQGDFERRLNLPVTALCDRHTTSVPKIQTGFFKYVVTPLISEWHRFLKNDLSAQMLKNLVYNQNEWELLIEQELAVETPKDVSEGELADDDDSSPNTSDSSEMLLPPPPRRSSLNPARPSGFVEQLRRFSVPLNVLQDVRLRSRERMLISDDLDPSLTPESLSPFSSPSENLVPESSIASITTPQQATRIRSVLREGSVRLSRQQTFPPMEGNRRPSMPRASSDDHCAYHDTKDGELRLQGDRTEEEGCSRIGEKLRENLSAVPLGLPPTDIGPRRKSMPAEVQTHRERKFRELCEVLPQLIKRTLSPRDILSRRRGSAPAPGSIDRVRNDRVSVVSGQRIGLSTSGSRVPRPCQLAQATPRRSSLPVEVTGISSY